MNNHRQCGNASGATWWPNLLPLQVAPPGGASSATWRPKLKLIQVTPPLRNLKVRTNTCDATFTLIPVRKMI